MCGRYVSVRSDEDLLREFQAVVGARESPAPETTAAPYNVAPTTTVRAVLARRRRDEQGRPEGEPVRQLRRVRWGLVPSWAKDVTVGSRMINARLESLPTKAAYRNAFMARRALIPADGWYEWRRQTAAGASHRQPFYLTPVDGHVLAFAGLYEFWSDPSRADAPTLTSVTIITCAAQGELAAIHERMPLLLPRSTWARWLDPHVADVSDVAHPWDQAAGEGLEARPVSAAVNSVANDGPELVRRVRSVPEQVALL